MNSTPRILHINTVADPRNGVGQIVGAIHAEAKKHKMQSAVFAGYSTCGKADYIVQRMSRKYVNALLTRLWREDGFLHSADTERLNIAIKKYNPDLIHLHNLHGYYADLPSLKRVLESLGKPVVVTLHDLWFATGRCAYPPEEACYSNIGDLCNYCPHPQRYPAKWIKGKSRVHEKTDFLEGCTIVTPSRWIYDRVKGAEKIIIPNGVDRNFFKPLDGVKKKKGQIFGAAAKWTETKGIDDIVRLADKLPEDYYFLLAGKGVPHHNRIKSAGIINDPSDMAGKMAESEVVISAARQEAYGITVAEALAVGTPVIARKNTAPEELIEDSSMLVDFAHAEEFMQALHNLPAQANNRKVISTTEMADGYYDLYRSLMNS